MHLPTAREFKANTLMMLRSILLTTQALEKLPGMAPRGVSDFSSLLCPSR